MSWWRIRLLVTGRAEWVNEDTGESFIEHEDWSTRWAMAGVHSWRWWWVRRFGEQDCGCTINPVTRRRVLFNAACWEHCGDLLDGDEG